MIVKLLTEHHLEFLSLKGGCRGSSKSTLVKMSNCWKSHATAQILIIILQVRATPEIYKIKIRLDIGSILQGLWPLLENSLKTS